MCLQDSDGEGLSDQEIEDEVDTFMFAGHDSTSSALSWCLYNLAKHPLQQDRCREETLGALRGKQQLTWCVCSMLLSSALLSPLLCLCLRRRCSYQGCHRLESILTGGGIVLT